MIENMKINKILTLATMALATLFTTSCSDSDSYSGPGAWDANEGFAQLYFESTSKTESIDPADPTTVTIKVTRRTEHQITKDDDGNIVEDKVVTPLPALTAKPTVLVNTDDVFTVSDAVFAEGEETANITVSFPNAEIGKQYTVQISFDDPSLVSQYSKDITYTYKVTRVKWNALGKATFKDDYYFGAEWEVDVLQRDDDKSYLRIIDPYWPTGGAGRTEALELHIMKKGDKIGNVELQDDGIVDWYRINTGYINSNYPGDPVWMLNAKNLTSYAKWDYLKKNYVSAYNADGSIGQIKLAAYYYLFGVGGGWNALEEEAVIINMPGFVEEYTAEISDYSWEPVFTGQFTSNKLDASSEAVLYKGVAKEDVEAENKGCYKRAEEAYGTPYVIADPYGTGKNLYFYVKGESIVVPADMMTPDAGDEEIVLGLQPTGLDALGDEVYAKINTGKSSFSEKVVSLNITFQTAPDKNGNFVEFGTTDEVLENIKWNLVGTGTYTYAIMLEGEDPGYEVYQREDKPDTYKVPDWCYGGDFVFTWNKTTNQCTVPKSFTGFVHPQVGNIYVADWVNWYAELLGKTIKYDDVPCYYDPDTKTFHFTLMYLSNEGAGWGSSAPTEETLQVEWSAASGVAKRAAAKKSKNLKVANKKVSKLAGAKSLFGKGMKKQAKNKNKIETKGLSIAF